MLRKFEPWFIHRRVTGEAGYVIVAAGHRKGVQKVRTRATSQQFIYEILGVVQQSETWSQQSEALVMVEVDWVMKYMI